MARIEKQIEVNVPVRAAYNQWTQFESFPRFMEGVEEVRQLDDTHLHWRVKVGGKPKEFDAEITEQVPDKTIAWRSIDGTQNAGAVQFAPSSNGSTLITFQMEYDPEGFVENVGDIVGVTSRRVEGDLERFKEFIESRGAETGEWRGEVHQGQKTGESGAATKQTATKSKAGAQGTNASQGRAARNAPASQGTAGAMERSGGALQSRRQSGLSAWEDPFSTVRRMADEMERMMEGFMGGGLLSPLGSRRTSLAQMWAPPVEIAQQGDNLVILADIPGVTKDELDVEIQNGVLTIEGDRREESEQEEVGFRRSERRYGHFYRAIQLPENVDTSRVEASMHDGVLEIKIPSPQRPQGRRLEIRG
jgi:HSP20 family molecular chaperone IbpA/uncharacterized membrane protein